MSHTHRSNVAAEVSMTMNSIELFALLPDMATFAQLESTSVETVNTSTFFVNNQLLCEEIMFTAYLGLLPTENLSWMFVIT